MLEFDIVIASFIGALMALLVVLLPVAYLVKIKLKKFNPLGL